MTKVTRVLQAYKVVPSDITPVTSRVYKVQSHDNSFSLKRSRLSMDKLNRWKKVYRIANEHHLASIVPVYMTQSGEIFQQHNNEIYYLTPWKEQKESDEPEHEMESFYHTLGKIHNQTKREQRVQTERMGQVIFQEKERLANYRKTLLAHVETFEQRRYMSPFELRVCMQYRDLEQVFNYLDRWYNYYLEDLSDDGISYATLCHGNLRQSHLIYQNSYTYFINWEHAYIGNGITDLASYYYHEFKYHDCYLNHSINAFSIYEKHNPLMQSERSLLAIYLLNPTSYFQVIDKYMNKDFTKSQPFQIKQLEQGYRRLMHGFTMQSHLYQIRQEIKDKELESLD